MRPIQSAAECAVPSIDQATNINNIPAMSQNILVFTATSTPNKSGIPMARTMMKLTNHIAK